MIQAVLTLFMRFVGTDNGNLLGHLDDGLILHGDEMGCLFELILAWSTAFHPHLCRGEGEGGRGSTTPPAYSFTQVHVQRPSQAHATITGRLQESNCSRSLSEIRRQKYQRLSVQL